MSMERPSDGDMDAANALIAENPRLQMDMFAKQVVQDGGIIEINGKKERVDIGDFLYARLYELEISDAEEKLAALRGRNPRAVEAAMVVSSVAPEHERELEN